VLTPSLSLRETIVRQALEELLLADVITITLQYTLQTQIVCAPYNSDHLLAYDPVTDVWKRVPDDDGCPQLKAPLTICSVGDIPMVWTGDSGTSYWRHNVGQWQKRCFKSQQVLGTEASTLLLPDWMGFDDRTLIGWTSGHGANRSSQHLRLLNIITGRVTVLDWAPLMRIGGFCATMGGSVYMSEGLYSSRVWRFDPHQRHTQRLIPHLHESNRYRPSALALDDDTLMVTGGHTKKCEWFHKSTNSWECIAPMIITRHSHAMALVDGSVYACGGINYTANTSSMVEVYRNEHWTMCKPMPIPGRCSAVTVTRASFF
jgi:hypothetical protein